MSAKLRVYLIGTGQQLISSGDLLLARGHIVAGVISTDEVVVDWCTAHQCRHTADAGVGLAWMQDGGCDYLFSIVNHAILSPAMLAVPARGAINYHDSLLPAYGGFNATSWAILEGQRRHGVTWHLMTEEADGGPILLQQAFDIADDDTAFTVGVKCSEAGTALFSTLLDQLEREALAPQAQVGVRSFHRRSERPGVAVLDFNKSAAELVALVRALDFGPDDSWMVKAKLPLPNGWVTVSDARVLPADSATPGMVVGISARGLEIGTGDGVVLVSELTDVDGTPLDPVAAAAAAGLRVGQSIPPVPLERVAALDDFDATITRSERFWVDRLATLRPATLPGLTAPAALPSASPSATPSTRANPRAVLPRTAPAILQALSADEREHALTAALAVLTHRLGGGDSVDLAARPPCPTSASRCSRPWCHSDAGCRPRRHSRRRHSRRRHSPT